MYAWGILRLYHISNLKCNSTPVLTQYRTCPATHLSQLQDQADALNLSTCKCSNFHDRPVTVYMCVCVCGGGAFFTINFMQICSPECYILLTSLTHTCHSYVRGFCCATKEHVLGAFDKLEQFHNFVMILCSLWGNAETQGNNSKRHRRGDGDSDSLLFCFCCVLVATNRSCRQEPRLNSHYCPNKDSSHSLITCLLRQNKSCMHTEKDSSFVLFFSFYENVTVAFVPAVCWSGRTDHLNRGSISIPPQKGLPTRDFYSCDVFHELSPGTRHGNESKSQPTVTARSLCTLTSAAYPV